MTHEELEGHEVRLFPSVHISSTREAELRAASSLLAMVRAVSEFGRIVVRAAGGPGGRIACYAEVSFKRGDPPLKTVRPDGIIRVVRGNTQWSALVEVKVGDSPLDPEQVEIYHKLAGEEGVDALRDDQQSGRPAQRATSSGVGWAPSAKSACCPPVVGAPSCRSKTAQ